MLQVGGQSVTWTDRQYDHHARCSSWLGADCPAAVFMCIPCSLLMWATTLEMHGTVTPWVCQSQWVLLLLFLLCVLGIHFQSPQPMMAAHLGALLGATCKVLAYLMMAAIKSAVGHGAPAAGVSGLVHHLLQIVLSATIEQLGPHQFGLRHVSISGDPAQGMYACMGRNCLLSWLLCSLPAPSACRYLAAGNDMLV